MYKFQDARNTPEAGTRNIEHAIYVKVCDGCIVLLWNAGLKLWIEVDLAQKQEMKSPLSCFIRFTEDPFTN